MEEIIQLKDIHYTWPGEEEAVLNIPFFSLNKGETLLLKGRSGSGKTTLLNLLAGINTVDKGLLRVMGKELANLSVQERDSFRGDHIGFIFQQFNLLSYLTVLENVLSPFVFSHEKRRKEEHDPVPRALELLQHMGLEEYKNKKVTSLSIGQQQRVTAARALMGRPGLIIADEPTSSLDQQSTREFLDLLFKETRSLGSTLIVVSHDSLLESYFDRSLRLEELNITGIKNDD